MSELVAINDVRRQVRKIIHVGKGLPDDLRQEILDLNAAATPALLEILENEELARSASPGEGWAPVHAARLLGELRAADAVQPMLRLLADTDPMDVLHDRIILSLPEIGEPVVEPALRAYAGSDDPDFKASVASVLARTGVRDDRIFALLLENLRTAPSHGAGDLAEYGDERAVPYLAGAFDEYDIVQGDGPFVNQDLVELHAAIEELGGTITAAQEKKFRSAMAPADRWREQMRTALESRSPARRPARPGRNEPCWCGSTKKYKKCHLVSDEAGASTDRARA